MPNPPRTAWVISDGTTGNERQALALSAALGTSARVLALPLRAPWTWFAPRRLPGGRLALAPRDRAGFATPWPEVAIGCGRSAALLTRLLRDLSGGDCYTVQILDPRIDPRYWDAVVVPRHDRLEGENVLTTLGSLNPVDDAWLASGREASADFAAFPSPRVATLIGGPRRRGVVFDKALAARVIETVREVAVGGSVLATTSRRTPREFAATVRDALAGFPGVFWMGDGTNPYPGILGWADRIVVTPDSVNMLSEACATGVPVHAAISAPLPPTLVRFYDGLRERGLLTEPGAARANVPPLRETQAVAAELLQRIATRTTTP
ncbi:MAG: mitochondrial fission ELM1 family protein [Rhodanobacteraceae bacterium]